MRRPYTFLETSTPAFPIFSYIFNGFFMFDLLLLFRCFLEVWPFRPFSLSFSTSGAGFSPFWVGASV
jgi:hypothetical protein